MKIHSVDLRHEMKRSNVPGNYEYKPSGKICFIFPASQLSHQQLGLMPAPITATSTSFFV